MRAEDTTVTAANAPAPPPAARIAPTDSDSEALSKLLQEMDAVLKRDKAVRANNAGSGILAAYCVHEDARRSQQACEGPEVPRTGRPEHTDAFVYFDRPDNPTRVYVMGPGPRGFQLLVARFTLAPKVEDRGCYAGFLTSGASPDDARWYHHLTLKGGENKGHEAFIVYYPSGDPSKVARVERMPPAEALNSLQMTNMLDPGHNNESPHSCLAVGRRNSGDTASPKPAVVWAGCSFSKRLVTASQASGHTVAFETGATKPTLTNHWLMCQPRPAKAPALNNNAQPNAVNPIQGVPNA